MNLDYLAAQMRHKDMAQTGRLGAATGLQGASTSSLVGRLQLDAQRRLPPYFQYGQHGRRAFPRDDLTTNVNSIDDITRLLGGDPGCIHFKHFQAQT